MDASIATRPKGRRSRLLKDGSAQQPNCAGQRTIQTPGKADRFKPAAARICIKVQRPTKHVNSRPKGNGWGSAKTKTPQHFHDAGILKSSWCPGEDSNLHVLQHWYLKPARLPIPPPGQCREGDVAKPSDRVNGEIMPRQGKKRPAGKGCVVIGLAALPA